MKRVLSSLLAGSLLMVVVSCESKSDSNDQSLQSASGQAQNTPPSSSSDGQVDGDRAPTLFGGRLAQVLGSDKSNKAKVDLGKRLSNRAPHMTPTGAPGAAASKTPGAATRDLWKFAPADASVGLVIEPGATRGLAGAFDEVIRLLRARPAGAQLLREMTRELGPSATLVLNTASWGKQLGFDPAFGGAIFFSPSAQVVLVAAVRDWQKFKKTFQINVPNFENKFCAPAGDYSVCAKSGDDAKQAAQARGGPLERRANGLPAWLHGDIEIVAHLPSLPIAPKKLAPLHQVLASLGTAAVAVRMQRGSLSIQSWIEGKPGGVIGNAFASLGQSSLVAQTAGGGNVAQFRLPTQLLFARLPASMPAGSQLDFRRDLLDNMTGDFVAYSRGTKFLGERLSAGIRNPVRVRKAIDGLCAVMRLQGIMTAVRQSRGACTGKVDLRKALSISRDIAGLVQGMPAVPLSIKVGAKSLDIGFGWVGKAKGTPGELASTPAMKSLMRDTWNLSHWGMAVDFVAAAPRQLQQRLQQSYAQLSADKRQQLDLLRWLYGHLYDAGLGVALRDDGLYLSMQLVTFAGDNAPAYAAHEQAVAALVGWKLDEYRQHLQHNSKAFPGSLTARYAQRVQNGASLTGQFGPLLLFAAAGIVASADQSRPPPPP